MKPIVAIVGRPNVGKSTLFNRICGARRAIVHDMPGVTRDRLYGEAVWEDKSFIVIDTGGFEPVSEDPILVLMREQTELAIEEADVIVFLLDARAGLTASDRETCDLLRRTSKPVHYVVNKVDGPKHDELVYEFHGLGVEHLHAVSGQHGRGISDLLDVIVDDFPGSEEAPPDKEGGIRVALVGRPNVGKSSLVNLMSGTNRSLVSPTPGTTRDAIDTRIRWEGKPFTLIDTAGIRRKGRIKFALEKFCAIKAIASLERSDVALLLLDASEGVTEQDARIGGYILERGRGCAILLNKWDLVEKDHKTHDVFVERIRRDMPHLDFAPIMTISAKTGQRAGRLYKLVETVYANSENRPSTAKLNQHLKEWLVEHPPPMKMGRRNKIYYITQPGVHPPTFVAVTGNPEGLPESYRRYLINKIRDNFDFTGAPIRLYIRGKDRKKKHRRSGSIHRDSF